ncbi:MAG: hypothetical protein ABIZ70_15040 [Gemmatimonadales bacterium]
MTLGNTTISALAWIALALHLLIGASVLRHRGPPSQLAWLNFAVAAAVLLYWGTKWYSYLFRGITWYLSDQWLPALAIVVCIVAALTIAGRYQGSAFHWLVFVVDTIVLIGAALFLTFFRMTRLI